MMIGSDDRDFRQQVGWCYEILPPHYFRDETQHYGPNPPYVIVRSPPHYPCSEPNCGLCLHMAALRAGLDRG